MRAILVFLSFHFKNRRINVIVIAENKVAPFYMDTYGV